MMGVSDSYIRFQLSKMFEDPVPSFNIITDSFQMGINPISQLKSNTMISILLVINSEKAKNHLWNQSCMAILKLAEDKGEIRRSLLTRLAK